MTTETDPVAVREWAKAAGIPVSERGRIKADVIAEYEAAHPLTEQDDGETALTIELPPEMPPTAPAEEAPAGDGSRGGPPRRPETPPQGKKTSRFRSRKTPDPKAKRKPRVSVATVGTWAWGLGGMMLCQFPQSTPVGRCLMIQSPVAGEVIDDLARGTILDTVLQPLARGSEKAEKAFALLGPPLLVGILANRPELAPALTPALKVALLSWAEISGPAMARAERKASQMAERMGEVDVDAMIAAMFADVPIQTQESPEEEDAIRRARGDG